MPRLALDAWPVESVRITHFLERPCSSDMLAGWAAVVGDEPEERTIKAALATYSANGPYRNGRLVLALSINRVDWLFTPNSADDPAATIGNYPSVVPALIDAIDAWAANSLPCSLNRIAIGLVLRAPVADRVAGYKALAEYLPSITIDAEGSSDLVYQINRARKSTVAENLRINRLSKWGAVRMEAYVASADSGGTAFQLVSNFIRAEFDINSAPESGLDLRPKRAALTRELLAMAEELATQGDIP